MEGSGSPDSWTEQGWVSLLDEVALRLNLSTTNCSETSVPSTTGPVFRAHGILQKVAGTHRYEVASFRRKILSALMTAKQTPINQLLSKAA